MKQAILPPVLIGLEQFPFDFSSMLATISLLLSPLCGEGQVLTRPPPSRGPSAGKQYHIHTFGCQMNSADSERMAGVLDNAGYSCTEDASEADVLIYNTCSIRDKGRAEGVLGAWEAGKAKFPVCLSILCLEMSQERSKST